MLKIKSIFAAAALCIFAVSTQAQTPTPWTLQVYDQGCLVITGLSQQRCGSAVLAHNSLTGDAYNCIGEFIFTGSPGPGKPPPPPDVKVKCSKLERPIVGPSTAAAPIPSALVNGVPVKAEDGNTRKYFQAYYWVIGTKIEDLRLCSLAQQPCSSAPSL